MKKRHGSTDDRDVFDMVVNRVLVHVGEEEWVGELGDIRCRSRGEVEEDFLRIYSSARGLYLQGSCVEECDNFSQISARDLQSQSSEEKTGGIDLERTWMIDDTARHSNLICDGQEKSVKCEGQEKTLCCEGKENVLQCGEEGAGEDCGVETVKGKLTIVIPLYWRPRVAFLRESLRAFAGMDVVDRIILVYNNLDWAIPRCIISEEHARGKIFSHRGGDLNERFAPRVLIRTEAVLSMDDEYNPSEEQLRCLLGVWERFPTRLVGPMWLATRHTEEIRTKDGDVRMIYGSGGWKGYYSLILTGFAVWHR